MKNTPLLVALVLALPSVALSAPAPVTRISFSRNPCYGFCPSYSVTLQSDGKATWKNGNFVSRLGDRKGRISSDKFAALARLVATPTFPALIEQVRRNTDKARRMSDGAGFSLIIERGNGKTEVEDYSFSAPPEFLRIEKTLEEAAQKIVWDYDDTGILEASPSSRKEARVFFIRLAASSPSPGQEVGRVRADAGQPLRVTLPPGDYRVERWVDMVKHEKTVKVIKGHFTSLSP